jgi:hypothetical protein
MTFCSPVLPRNRGGRQSRIAETVANLPTATTMADRILEVWGQATDAEHADGRAWYPAAGHIADTVAELARAHGATFGDSDRSAGAGIVAALSPQCSWDENITRALAFADGLGPIGGLADGVGKSTAIAAGAHPGEVLGGRKVRSFWHNIIGHRHHVTVDRHAVAIVYGRPLDDREIKVLERCGAYTYIAAVYRAVARRLAVDPATLQAVTWLAWRRLKATPFETAGSPDF